jgi:uncharacterized membrane protein (DUF441 family)
MAPSRTWIDRSALALGLVALLIGVLAPVVVTVDSRYSRAKRRWVEAER